MPTGCARNDTVVACIDELDGSDGRVVQINDHGLDHIQEKQGDHGVDLSNANTSTSARVSVRDERTRHPPACPTTIDFVSTASAILELNVMF